MWKLARSSSLDIPRLSQRGYSSKKHIQILNPSAALNPYKADLNNVAVKKPIWVKLEAGKEYKWCSCGLSGKQPWCDDHVDYQCHHKFINYARPVKFQVDKDGEYCICMCKQTNKRPLCDGSHKAVPKPRSEKAVQLAMYGDSPVYDGVAHKLGYNPKDKTWQK